MRIFPLVLSLFWLSCTAGIAQDALPGQLEKGKDGQTGVIKEVWRSGVTSSLFDFEDLVGWRRQPDETGQLPGFSFAEESPGNAVVKLTGWFEPEVSGEFVFWIASQGPGKLVVSQPGSIAPLGKGAFMYYSAGLGWPRPGQWDLYPKQRCGPWMLEKGHRYLLEFWYAGRPGTKHAALSWSASPGGPLKDWAELADARSGRLSSDGAFLPADSAAEAKAAQPAGEETLFPAGAPVPPRLPGDALLLQFHGNPMVQRITVSQKLRPTKPQRQSDVSYRVIALNNENEILAETSFRPEAEPMAARFEWELPALLPVAKVIVALAGETPVKESDVESTPFAVEAWGPADDKTPLTPRALLSGPALAAARNGPTDENGNGLEDTWEARFPKLRKAGDGVFAAEDPDHDGLLNQMESLAGRDPLAPDQLGSRLTAEYWRNVRQSDVPGLFSTDAFHRPPDVRVVRWMDRYAPLPTHTGLRLRGYLTAPATGDYTFWIAAQNAGQLWISEDAAKFRKYKIAELSPALGSAHGVSRMALDQWDQFSTQRSRPIKLEAGKTYFLEALAQQGGESSTGQLSLAWLPPGGVREVLEGKMLQSYIPVTADADDDYLPDDWERLFKLDPADNGLTDRARQGERGDFDSDGLSNLLEYQWQLDPTNSDTDGDGATDGDEYHHLRTDPRSKEGVRESTDVLTINPASFSSSTLPWHSIGGVLTAGQFRGEIAWKFDLPAAGYYGFSFHLGLMGQVLPDETMPLRLSVDDQPVSAAAVTFRQDQPTTWSTAGPWLEAGPHTLRLVIDNSLIRRSLSIHSLTVFQPTGADFDHDGLPEWFARELATGFAMRPPAAATSFVSPVCVEGVAPGNPTAVTVNGLPARPLGRDRWYSDVFLEHDLTILPTAIKASLPGRPASTAYVTWQPLNVLTDTTLDLRVGDSVILAAFDTTGRSITASCEYFHNPAAPGMGTARPSSDFSVKFGMVETFTEPGTYLLRSQGDKRQGTLTFRVAAATLPDEILLIENLARTLPLAPGSLTPDVILEGTAGLEASRTPPLAASANAPAQPGGILLLPRTNGELALTARLSPGGPILAAAPVRSLQVADAMMQDSASAFMSGAPAGFFRLRSPLFVQELPTGATVEIRIMRAGVMFADGSTIATFRAADFSDGLLWLEFFYPAGMAGGYCHYITIRDKDGQLVGRR